MGDANPIHTLRDYSRPSHEGYMNTIELPVGNNVVPLCSDTIRIHHHMGGSYYSFPCSILSTRKDCKTPQRYPDDPTTSTRVSIRSMDSFQGLTTKVLHHGIDRWLQIQIFYDHVSFHLKYEIDRAADGKLRDKNADESWKIIKNLAFYDHEGWNDSKNFVKPVKAVSTPQSTSKTPDRRLLELEDQINFLLKGSRPTPRPSSMHVPQAYAKAREEINDRMAKMFELLKELTTSRAPKKVLIREEAKSPVTKIVNSISLTRGEEEKSDKDGVATDDDIEKTNGSDTKMPVKEAETENEVENRIKNKAIKRDEKEKGVKAPNS
ncbi:hypothetical protein Tco_0814083 [Tanacetum coccineum]